MLRNPRLPVMLHLAVLWFCACSDGSQEPAVPPVVDLSVSPFGAAAQVYSPVAIRADVRAGQKGVAGVTLTWSAYLLAQCNRPIPELCHLPTVRIEPATSTTDASGAAVVSLTPMTAGNYRVIVTMEDGTFDTISIASTIPASADESFAWTPLPDMIYPRHGAGAAVFAGRIYVVGGYCSFWRCGYQAARPTVQIFDPVTNTWSEGAPPPANRDMRVRVLAASLADGVHALSQGYHDVYHPDTDTWSTRAAAPADLRTATLEAHGEDLFLTVAGAAGTAWHYNVHSDTWYDLLSPPDPGPILLNSIVSTVRGSLLYVAAGSSLMRYDAAPPNPWSLFPEQPLHREAFTGGMVGDHFCVVGGGRYTARATHTFAETYCFHLPTSTWSLAAPLPDTMRAYSMGMAAVELGAHLYVFGGSYRDYGSDNVASRAAARLSLR